MVSIFRYFGNALKTTISDQWTYFMSFLMVSVSGISLSLEFNALQFFFIVAMSAAIGFFIVLTANFLRRWKMARLTLLILFVVILNIMCVTDVFLAIKFDKTFDDEIFFVVLNATDNETTGFFKTFVDLIIVLKVAAIVLLCDGLSYLISYIAMRLQKKNRKIFGVVFAAMALIAVVFFVMRITGYTDMQIRSVNVLCEYLHPLAMRNNGFLRTRKVVENCRSVAGNVNGNPSDSTIYVVIVGESHNKTHTSLYNYRYNTMPRMKRRMTDGELVAFDKCITKYYCTNQAFKTIISLSNDLDDIESYALFPAVFHEAGYRTECYDNQFTFDSNLSIITDPEINAMSFDYSTNEVKDYDGDMIDGLMAPTPRSMVFINLNGQHFFYDDRVPIDFKRPFTLQDYKDIEDYKRQSYCDYDNATYYVDSMLERIIRHYDGYNTCVLYASDHGQAVWEDGKLGHGIGKHPRQDITFFVWGSEKFRASEKWKDIVAASHKTITSSDISHALLDLAGIKFSQMDPKRSFVNNQYAELQ